MKKKIYQPFVDRLVLIRKENGETQQQIADKLSFSRTGYSSWEQGLSQPSLEDIVKLCAHFGISSDYLLGLSSIRKPQSAVSLQSETIPRDPLSDLDDDLRIKADAYLEALHDIQRDRIAASKQEA